MRLYIISAPNLVLYLHFQLTLVRGAASAMLVIDEMWDLRRRRRQAVFVVDRRFEV